MTVSVPARSVELHGVFNFRDLGGYPTVDGRNVRWRTLFRADGLGRLTEDDVEVLRPIGLRTVIDLRTRREIDERGRFPIESYPVTFHHLSVLDRTWDREQAQRESLPATEFLHRAYTSMLDEGAPRFAAAFGVLADPDALPAVFHCAAGKDRTGLLAALVLGGLGVERDTIVSDYALTQQTMDRFLAAANENPRLSRSIATVPPSFFAADPAAISLVLDDIDRRHGSVRGYLGSIGIEADVVDRLQDVLLSSD